MKTSPILSIREATISFAKKVLFENLHLNLFPRDRICLIGKNGVGKTSLMNAIAGQFEFDHGERWIMPNAVLGYLSQSEYLPENLTVADFILSGLKIDEHKTYIVDIVCDNLQIDKNALTQNLSGGQKRRVSLARALVLEPDILLLDEPTNHLDLEIIEWLENYLQSFQGALIVISHDRKFLEKVSNKVFWLRAGQIKINQEGYKNFDEWSSGIIEHERRELENLQKKVTLESGWLQTGVTARRKRNIGRLHYLQELRQKLEAQRKLVRANQSYIKIESQKIEEDAPQVILSFNNVNKSYGDKKIIDKFSLKILRGERIGIIGKNGSGKSTLLKMIVGEVDPDSGTVKPARDILLSYFDQSRSKIKPTSTIQEILCETGGEYVTMAGGKVMHICGYLKNFLFDPNDREALAGTLSGGQQNRLLLAKTLANPGNFMILDEPTNDLDMDTLDMLQEYLEKYEGTLIVVSHDRDFLDNVATSILAFEGRGKITTHIGGYSDYLEYKEKYKADPVLRRGDKLSNNNSAPIVTSSKPIVTPSAPIVTPSAPIVTPSAPIVTPSTPILTPSNPILTSSNPIVTPSTPILTPSAPIATPSTLIATPSTPIVTPSAPILTPSNPILTSSNPIVTPSTPIVTPSNPIVTPSHDGVQRINKKLSYKLKFELEKLPAKIEKLENKIRELSEELSETDDRSSANLAHISMEIAKYQKDLNDAEERWLELEDMK